MEQVSKLIEYKFILLGDSSVGKSSIFGRLSGKMFSKNIMPTIGVDKIIINFNDVEINENENIKKNFKVSLFDTVGEERYRSITKSYFRDSNGIILLYSIVDETSFQHIQIWLDSIKDSLSDWKRAGYIVMLLGNKLDLVQENIEKREIPTEEVEKICLEKDIYWGGECSAKTFSESQLKEIFRNMIKKIYLKLGDEVINESQKSSKIIDGKEIIKRKPGICFRCLGS